MFSCSWSWENPFPFFILLLSGLNWDPFWFWPDQVIAHSRVFCIVTVHAEPCLLSGRMGLMIAAVLYMILLTLCLNLHLWYHPSIHSFIQHVLNIHGQSIASLGEINTSSCFQVPLPISWLSPFTPNMVWSSLVLSSSFSSTWQPNPSLQVRDTWVYQGKAIQSHVRYLRCEKWKLADSLQEKKEYLPSRRQNSWT